MRLPKRFSLLSFHQDEFLKNLPSEFFQVREILKKFHFTPTIVGGIVRDFILTSQIGQDWDIELTHPLIPFQLETWKDFGANLRELGKVTFHPYEVLKLVMNDISFEFSPPRREIFKDHLFSQGHKNFEVEFNFKMSFDQAVLRRDFTINAMGVRFYEGSVEFLDPLKGLKDLESESLQVCSDDFNRDPVRFLRAYRFKRKFQFHFSENLASRLSVMSLEGLSSTYVWAEMQKSKDPWRFYLDLHESINTHKEFPLPRLSDTNEIKDLMSSYLKNPTSLFSWVLALELSGGKSKSWVEYFKFSPSEFKKIQSWVELVNKLKDIYPKDLQGEFQELLNRDQFLIFYQWYFSTKQFARKYSDCHIKEILLLCLPQWSFSFNFPLTQEVNHIAAEKRSLYQIWNLCQKL